VNDPQFVGVFQSTGCLNDAANGFRNRKRTTCADSFRKILPIAEGHHEEVGLLGLVSVKGGDDIRMFEFGSRFDFSLEAFDLFRRIDGRMRQDLERHHAIHLSMEGFVDGTHAPFADFVQNHIAIQHQRQFAAFQQHRGLKRREMLTENELTSEGNRIGGRIVTSETRHLFPIHQLRVHESLAEPVQSDGGCGGKGFVGPWRSVPTSRAESSWSCGREPPHCSSRSRFFSSSLMGTGIDPLHFLAQLGTWRVSNPALS
jgi:hypothetical protein